MKQIILDEPNFNWLEETEHDYIIFGNKFGKSDQKYVYKLYHDKNNIISAIDIGNKETKEYFIANCFGLEYVKTLI